MYIKPHSERLYENFKWAVARKIECEKSMSVDKLNLKSILKKRKQGFNQKEIAKQVGISQGQLSNIFNGRRKASPELIKKINTVVGIKFSQN